MPKIRIPTEKMNKFAKEYVTNGHDAQKAHEKTYVPNLSYPHDYRVKKTQTFMKNPQVAFLIQWHEENLIKDARKNFEKLQDLRDTSPEEKIQLDASKVLMTAYNETVNRIQKQEEKEQTQTTNMLIINMSDDELKTRIRALVSGAEAQGTQDRPAPSNGRSVGLSEPGTVSSGDLESADDSGDGTEEGTLPASSGSPEIYDADDSVSDTTDYPEP